MQTPALSDNISYAGMSTESFGKVLPYENRKNLLYLYFSGYRPGSISSNNCLSIQRILPLWFAIASLRLQSFYLPVRLHFFSFWQFDKYPIPIQFFLMTISSHLLLLLTHEFQSILYNAFNVTFYCKAVTGLLAFGISLVCCFSILSSPEPFNNRKWSSPPKYRISPHPASPLYI